MNSLLIGTRKGLLIFENENGAWKLASEHFLGARCTYACKDPRTGHLWACLDHGHWGCKLHRSEDGGKTWIELEAPKYPEGEEVKDGVPAKTELLWTLQPGGKDEPGTLYIGTIPGGLFKSTDHGATWELNRGLWDQPTRKEGWFGGGYDHPGIHSILIDPNDSQHIFIAISCAGVFETRDGGQTWAVRSKGLRADFLPNPDSEVGQDPHILVAQPHNINQQWQQNHCGIFRSQDGAATWQMVSQKGDLAHFGFAVAVDDQDPETAWVVPAIADEVRVPVNRKLVVCRTRDGGKSWQELGQGLPQKDAYDLVYRHALDQRAGHLAMGSTTGNLFFSADKGESWQTLSSTLPPVFSVRFG
ncbi:MAG: glycosyl hydrolase [Bacteroidia bacterium]|nr:glycosyl hydrolase [Bacteroidia bacterium]